VIPRFEGLADFQIRFQPYQLYPDLPTGDHKGVNKKDYLTRLNEHRRPGMSQKDKEARVQGLRDAWAHEGLGLTFDGNLGNSFDAQRMIWLAREQNKEDAMIEQIYSSSHEDGKCLSDWQVLLKCASKAGVTGARAMLESDAGKQEVIGKIQMHMLMGITAVPVIVFNEKHVINGAPEVSFIEQCFSALVEGRAPPIPAHM